MASRDWLRQWTNANEPAGSNLGDEWYNSTSNVLTKRLAINGTTPGWQPLVYVNTLTQTALVPGNIETTGSVIISNVGVRTTASTNLSNQSIGTRNLIVSGGIEAKQFGRPWHFIDVPASATGNLTIDLSSATVFCIQLGNSSSVGYLVRNAPSPGQEVEFRIYVRQPTSGAAGNLALAGANWANGQQPTLSTGNGLVDIYSFTILGGFTQIGLVVAQGITLSSFLG